MTEHSGHGALDNAYGGLVEADSDARWAFGTGFDDPLAGVDVSVPPGVDAQALATYSVMLADDALVSAQRLTEWCTRAPELEEEVALANIALDLLGQARLLLARAAAADPAVVPQLPAGSPVPADDRLAFFRGPDEYRCVRLVELPNGDFATTIVRLLVFSAWRLAVLDGSRRSVDPVLAALADKGVKEVWYHRDHAARWLQTLAGGTPESRQRCERALAAVWPYVAELGRPVPATASLVEGGVAVDPEAAWAEAEVYLRELLAAAGLAPPAVDVTPGAAGRDGVHTEWLAPLLEEMQHIARAHPLGRW